VKDIDVCKAVKCILAANYLA